MSRFSIYGNIVDIINRDIFPGEVEVEDGKIAGISRHNPEAMYKTYIMPGFIDAHVHIESSMIVPSEFARIAACHGTVGTVSDPHEIANVLGIDGVRFMMENGGRVPFKFYFGAPSCVPATVYETSGGTVSPEDIKTLLEDEKIRYMSEMMNFPGVLFGDPIVLEKLSYAREAGKPVDGHAPGLRGDDARRYADAGISTDHECFTLDEAREKISYGMKILIREGSAAKNFDALHPLIAEHPNMCMFCSDDIHPDSLTGGHINKLVRRAVAMGYDLINVLRCATMNPINHYGLDAGLIRQGDSADFIVVNDLKNFHVLETYVSGILTAVNGSPLINPVNVEPVNKFEAVKKVPEDFAVPPKGKSIRVIEVIDGELITGENVVPAKILNNNVISDTERDILKIAVVNRYEDAKPSIGFIRNFGLKKGAIAASIAHDSHNIIAVGTSDIDICKAVNEVIENKGGLAALDAEGMLSLPLPVAGLMSNLDAYKTAELYSQIEYKAKQMGSALRSPFMTLSFMALLVIPALKLSDKGLFDGRKFEFVDLFV